MQKSWATSGADLHLDLARGGTGVRRRLEDALREAIHAGRLTAGARLPSSRALAADLGVARNTVAEAYGQLTAEGWLVAVRGSGTSVAQPILAPAPGGKAGAAGTAGELAAGRAGPGRAGYSLEAGSPDLSSFPRAAWLAATRRALDLAPAGALGYGDPRGRPELRLALAEYLGRARGVRAAAERIVVCSGFTQALGLLAQVLAARGADRLAVEAWGHQHHREVITARGLAARPLPVDAGGAVTSALDGDGGALLTPAHQFPLGVPLAAARRTQAAEWAASSGAILIEDDYDGEFRYDRQAVGAMQALAPESIVYAGTASKTLIPGLRLAWLVLPAGLVEEVAAAKLLADRQTGCLDQLTMAELITSGAYDRHVRRARQAYRRRREQLEAALAQVRPAGTGRADRAGLRLAGVPAGLHALLELPPGRREEEVTGQAAARGLAVGGLREYATEGARHPQALVVGFATPPAHAYTTAIARLCAVLGAGPGPEG